VWGEKIKTSLKFLLNMYRAIAEAVRCQLYTTEVQVGFVMDKVALGRTSYRVLPFSPSIIIPPLFHMMNV
jgi:hypothetical protein